MEPLAALVSCDGTGLTVASGSDQSSGTNAGGGFPTLLRFPTTAGKHSVVVTVTSATASTNFVQIEFIAGNTDLQAGVRATVVGLCLRMNAAGYLGAPAAYGSQIIGDAVVALYQRAQREICNQFIADGFDIRIADSNSFYDPTVVANVQADNIHPTQAGQVTIANSMIAAWNRGQAVQQTAGGSSFIQTRPAPTSAAFVQNTSAFPIEVFITGGTVTSVNFSRDGINNIQVSGATPAQVRLNSGDWYAVTYTVAPTINVIPR